jgi:DNA-binding NarL/FixJ family response regulator
VRGAICSFIDRATPFKACCEAGNGDAAVEKARERAPALVILDLNMPMLHGIETASALRTIVPTAKIIGLAMFAGEYRRTQLAAAGFDMIVSKSEGLAKLAEAITVLLPEALPQAGVREALLPPFAIFKVAGDGRPIWVQSSPTLDNAKARIQTLGLEFPGTYIIHSQKTGRQTVVTVNKTGGIVQ